MELLEQLMRHYCLCWATRGGQELGKRLCFSLGSAGRVAFFSKKERHIWKLRFTELENIYAHPQCVWRSHDTELVNSLTYKSSNNQAALSHQPWDLCSWES